MPETAEMSTEKRRTVLFLPKWYPDRKQDQNGNFIQQHAQAAAQFANVIVLYANVSDFQGSKVVQFEFKKDGGGSAGRSSRVEKS